ncbi:hypothetical protein FQA39_LY04985 [Lamprigera yunnana]|nr:hypothetical protein FQA39_LY04985 [Lamprigera yunnana]
MAVYTVVARGMSGRLCLTELATKTDRNSLTVVECTGIHNSLRQEGLMVALALHSTRIVELQVSSRRDVQKHLQRMALCSDHGWPAALDLHNFSDLDMEKEQLHNTQSEIEDLTLIEHLAEGFETGELEIVQDTQPTIPVATGSNSCSTTSDPSPIEFMPHKRRRVETTANADTLTESIQMIGSKMQNLIDSSNVVDPLDQDILFGNSVAAFLNKCPERKAKNEFKKKVFILMMDHEFQ